MKIDNASLTSTVSNSQISDKRDEEKLKSFTDALDSAKESGDDDKLKEVSQQFEAFFINSIFKSMRQSADWGEGMTEKSHARGIYEGMMDEKMSDEIATGRGIGISDMIYKQMAKRYNAVERVDEVASEAQNASDKSETKDKEKTSEVKSLDLKG